jgi:hypothetical protein
MRGNLGRSQKIDMAGRSTDRKRVRLTAIPRNSSSPLMSTINSGEIRRGFIAGIRLSPPDNTFALSPCVATGSSVSLMLVARA